MGWGDGELWQSVRWVYVCTEERAGAPRSPATPVAALAGCYDCKHALAATKTQEAQGHPIALSRADDRLRKESESRLTRLWGGAIRLSRSNPDWGLTCLAYSIRLKQLFRACFPFLFSSLTENISHQKLLGCTCV